jgi:hypothetical protein
MPDTALQGLAQAAPNARVISFFANPGNLGPMQHDCANISATEQ